MSEAPTRIDPRWRPPIAASLTLLVVIVVLGIQHARHGWPFSLHHGMPAQSPADRATSAGDAALREAEHEGEIPGAARAALELDAARLEAFGVTFEAARFEELGSEVRAVATVVPDEARLAHVHTRVSGWIDRLHVRTTGVQVRAGQQLAAIFSRELLASQTEYLSVRRAARGTPSPLLEGARQRLNVLGMTEGEIRALERRGQPIRNVPVNAPRAGTVLHRGVTEGTAVDPSTELFVIGDLSRLWVLAEIPESSVANVHVGSRARIEVAAAGGAPIDAEVAFVYPTLTERTRTLRVRFEVPNPDGSLRPGMFGTAVFEVGSRRVLTVPRDAIVDTGRHQHVFVRTASGRLEPRAIEPGARLGDRVAVTSGVSEGDIVAASGVFVIDSESRLRATGAGALGGHQHGATSESETTTPSEPAPAGGHGGHGG